MRRTHQQSRQIKHRKTFPATCCSEIGTAFSVAFRFAVLLDIVKQFVGSIVLRVTAQYLFFFFSRIGKPNEVMQNITKSLLVQHSVDNGCSGMNSRQCFLFFACYFMPTVEKIVRRKQRACFIVHPIADDAERIVFHQFRNISSVADA